MRSSITKIFWILGICIVKYNEFWRTKVSTSNMKTFSLHPRSKFNIFFREIQLRYTKFDISEYIFVVIYHLDASVFRKSMCIGRVFKRNLVMDKQPGSHVNILSVFSEYCHRKVEVFYQEMSSSLNYMEGVMSIHFHGTPGVRTTCFQMTPVSFYQGIDLIRKHPLICIYNPRTLGIRHKILRLHFMHIQKES